MRHVRYAIYFAPAPASTLHAVGSAWLGRDAISGETIAPPPLNGLTHARWRHVTASPQSYGLHATLKAPFHLAPGVTRDDLVRLTQHVAAASTPFIGPRLTLARLSGFFALIPAEPSERLADLAAACVRDVDALRATAAPDERARRLQSPLTGRQRELLDRWGYPYVLDEWRFHVTLATAFDPGEADSLCALLERVIAPACEMPIAIDAISLFEQPAPDEPFRATARFPLGRVHA
jgi:putative phosphonate metabolism protein